MKIYYETAQKNLKTGKEENLLELCLTHKIPISHSCEGGASCGTCRIIVTQGVDHLPERNPLEEEMALDRNFKKVERLACQTSLPLTSDLHFRLPNEDEI